MLRVNFYLKDLTNKEKETLINLFVTYKKERIKISTGERIAPKHWNKETGTVKTSKSFERGTSLSIKLNEIEKKVQRTFSNFRLQFEKDPEVFELKNLLVEVIRPDIAESNNTTEKKAKDFIEFFQMQIDKMGDIVSGTKRKRKYILTVLSEFRPVIRWWEINSKFYEDYEKYLRTTKGYALNTIGSHIKVVKTMLKRAEEKEYISKVPSMKAYSETTEAIALSFEELIEVERLDNLHPYQDNARDIFILGCCTGLRWGDLSRLSIKEHFNLENRTITIKTSKTGKTVVIPFLPQMERLLKKYNKDGVQTLPRFISGQNFNVYIKEVMQKLDFMNETVTKHITKEGMYISTKPKYKMVAAHTCRRTFATVCFRRGIKPHLIMSVTGHKTETEFYKYIRITPDENAKELLAAFTA